MRAPFVYTWIESIKFPSVVEEPEKRRTYRFHMHRELIHTFRTYSDLNLSTSELTMFRIELRY